MYPNPQDALPLPSRPTLDQYRKRAKELVKACKSSDPKAITTWATEWLDSLGASHQVDQLVEFARVKLTPGREPRAACTLANAQFAVARAQGFLSWPKFVKHLQALSRESSPVSTFEAAAEAIVDGDLPTVERLLREHPGLIRARSTREHRATLLHYVAANGVENYRQKTPRNAAMIAECLLEAGADVHAPADVYGGGATTLGLAATSCHPFKAGVQTDLIDVLLKHGAPVDDRHGAGNDQNLVNGCLANGRGEAAVYLASRGATLDLEGAAGVGRLDVVQSHFGEDGGLKATATTAQMRDGFSWACGYGRFEVVEYLASKGLDLNAPLRPNGQTGLHAAAYGGHVEVARLLVQQGASVDVADERFGSTPTMWALYAWGEEHQAPPERYCSVVELLVEAGAKVERQWLEDEKVRDNPKMQAALTRKSIG